MLKSHSIIQSHGHIVSVWPVLVRLPLASLNKFCQHHNCLKKKENILEKDHIVLKKEPSIPDTITEAANDEIKLKEEFKKLEEEAQQNYAFPTNIAQKNMQHNRYKDIGKLLQH